MDIDQDTLRRLDRVNRLARFMDTAVRIPGTRWRIGADTIVGLVPGVGDTLALLPGLYILGTAARMGVPRATLLKMGANVGLDWAVGSVPILGDVFDAAFKANRRNADLLNKAVSERAGVSADLPAST